MKTSSVSKVHFYAYVNINRTCAYTKQRSHGNKHMNWVKPQCSSGWAGRGVDGCIAWVGVNRGKCFVPLSVAMKVVWEYSAQVEYCYSNILQP